MRHAVAFALLLVLSAAPAADGDWIARGRELMARGEFEAARRLYGEAVQRNPFDPVALNNLAVAHAAQGDRQTARALLQRARQVAPYRGDIVENLQRLEQDDALPPQERAPAMIGDLPPPPPPRW